MKKTAKKAVKKVAVKKVAKKAVKKVVAEKVEELELTKKNLVKIKDPEVGKKAIIEMNEKISRKIKAINRLETEEGFFLNPKKYPVTIAKCKQIQIDRLVLEINKLKRDIDYVAKQISKLESAE